MSALDDKINTLSDQELDLLNSDPQLLSDFKAKYGASYGDTVAKNALEGLKQTPDLLAQNAKTGAALMPLISDGAAPIGAVGQMVSDVAEGKSLSDAITQSPYTKALETAGNLGLGAIKGIGSQIADVARVPYAAYQMAVDKTPASQTDIAKKFEAQPISTGLNVLTAPLIATGMGEAGPESGVRSFADELSQNSDSTLAKLNKKLANIPENSTKMKGYNEPVPSSNDLEQATQNVIQAYSDVSKEHGDMLNAAKKNAGLPTTLDEKEFSNRRYGNEYGLNVNAPLDLAADSPKSINPGDALTLRASSPEDAGKLSDLPVTYKGPMMKDTPEKLKELGFTDDKIASATQPTFDIGNELPGHPAKSTLTTDTLKKLGYDVPDPKAGVMPYKIGEHDSPKDLDVEVSRFLENRPYIDKPAQIKAASYFQDLIKKSGAFSDNSTLGSLGGRLKGKYGDLAALIKDNAPELQAAKSKFASFTNSLDQISSKLDPEKPGATQAYLKRLFVSGSPEAKDKLNQLAHFEKLTGKPVVTELFKKFAGKSFEGSIGSMVTAGAKLAGGIGLGMYGHPVLGTALASSALSDSPRMIGALESAVPNIAPALARRAPALVPAAMKGLNTMNTNPALQSLRDRMANAKK